MKISLNYNKPYIYQYNRNNKTEHNKVTNPQNFQQTGIIPYSAQILAFMGGKSLNLADTVKQIDKYGQFPDGIRDMAMEIIERGNPENKTLIDVHKAKYNDLYACDNLEEVRFFFPEFKDVLSDTQVLYKENSFIDAVKKGEVPYFDKDIDVALQLLQMYWAEGISFLDFRNEFAGRNIYKVFQKLNIPTLNSNYAHYLSFSDKTKNERFTAAMRHRNNGSADDSLQDTDSTGKKHKPLTAEHKAKISESLKKYYEEHPEMSYYLSEKALKYLEENPKQKEVFSQVLLRAWSYPEAKPIRKALSKYMKVPNLSAEEIIKLSTKTFNQDLKAFWDKNSWAKKNFSLCMKKSWKRQKEITAMGLIYEPIAIINLLPESIENGIKKSGKYNQRFDEVIRKHKALVLPDHKDEPLSKFPAADYYADFIFALLQSSAGNNSALFEYNQIRLFGILDGLEKLQKLAKKGDKTAESIYTNVKEELQKILQKYKDKKNSEDHKSNFVNILQDLDMIYIILIAYGSLGLKRQDIFDIFQKSTKYAETQSIYNSEGLKKKSFELQKGLLEG